MASTWLGNSVYRSQSRRRGQGVRGGGDFFSDKDTADRSLLESLFFPPAADAAGSIQYVIMPTYPTPGNMRLMWSSLIDSPTTTRLIPSSAAINVNNIRQLHRKRVWRTTSKTNQTLIIDLQSVSLDVRCVALTGYNLTPTGTVQLQTSDDGSSWTPLQQKAVENDTTLFFFFFLSNKRYWRLIFNDSANTDPYIEVGRIFLGDYWEPTNTILRNWSIKVIDRSEVRRSIGQQKWTNQKDLITQVSFQLPPLNETDGIKNFLNIARRIGLSRDVFLALMPDAAATYREVTGFYGRFANVSGVASISSFAYDAGSIVFEESF